MFWDYLALHWPTAIAVILGSTHVGRLYKTFKMREGKNSLASFISFP